jgi:hypothetical protein
MVAASMLKVKELVAHRVAHGRPPCVASRAHGHGARLGSRLCGSTVVASEAASARRHHQRHGAGEDHSSRNGCASGARRERAEKIRQEQKKSTDATTHPQGLVAVVQDTLKVTQHLLCQLLDLVGSKSVAVELLNQALKILAPGHHVGHRVIQFVAQLLHRLLLVHIGLVRWVALRRGMVCVSARVCAGSCV